SALVPGDAAGALFSVLRQAFTELTTTVRALAAIGDVPPRSHDAIVAMGELASSRIVAEAFAARQIPAVWIDARDVLVTDAEHMAALPDMAATCDRAQRLIAPK